MFLSGGKVRLVILLVAVLQHPGVCGCCPGMGSFALTRESLRFGFLLKAEMISVVKCSGEPSISWLKFLRDRFITSLAKGE